jgi:hypothetical protein
VLIKECHPREEEAKRMELDSDADTKAFGITMSLA